MLDIELKDIQDICGNYKQKGKHYYFQCYYCKDKKSDNLIYTPSKELLKCFANDTHAPMILSEIMKKKRAIEQPQQTQKPKQWQINLEEYILYQEYCNSQLLASDKALNYLYEHRLITPFTVEKCGLGYDFEANKWVIPIYSLKESRLVGFEYRLGDFTQKKIRKEHDTPACISEVWGKRKNENLYITEGMLDACILTQWMEYPEDSTIYSPSNGVASLETCITEINFTSFDNIYLCLDNDKAGHEMTAKLIEKYPFIIDKTPKPDNGKDISDLYLERTNK